MSLAFVNPIGFNSTPSDWATAWMMAHCPIPATPRFPQDGRARDRWSDHLEQFHPFPAQAVFKLDEASDIAARPRHALNVSVPDWVDALRENDRYGTGHLLQCKRGCADPRQDHIRPERNQFLCISAQTRSVADAPAIIDPQIALNRPTGFL